MLNCHLQPGKIEIQAFPFRASKHFPHYTAAGRVDRLVSEEGNFVCLNNVSGSYLLILSLYTLQLDADFVIVELRTIR